MHTHTPHGWILPSQQAGQNEKGKKKMEQMLRMLGQGHVEHYTSFEYKATVSGGCLFKKNSCI